MDGGQLFWRAFDNRRQVGACVGLVPHPYDSGESRVDQGISKQGNRRVRALLIEMAWFWLRYQPDSALAHKLAIALWRYLEHGVMPAGAQFKSEPAA